MPKTIFSTLREKFKNDFIPIEDALEKAYQEYQRHDYDRFFGRSSYDEFVDEERMTEPDAFGFFVKHAIKHPKISNEAKEFICEYHINRPQELSDASNLLSAMNFLISREKFDVLDEKLILKVLASFDRGRHPKDVESKVQFIGNLMKSEKLTKQFKLQLPNYIFTRSFCEGCPGEIFNTYMSSETLADEEKLNLCQSFIGKRKIKNEIFRRVHTEKAPLGRDQIMHFHLASQLDFLHERESYPAGDILGLAISSPSSSGVQYLDTPA